MPSVAEVVAARQVQWGEPITERSIFGTGNPAEIASTVDAWCKVAFGSASVSCELFAVSVGCVFGLTLPDGERVVVKSHRRRVRPAYLGAVQHCQQLLYEGGVPCPRPLVPPAPIGEGWAIAETFEDDPQPDAMSQISYSPHGLRASASGLMRVVEVLNGVDDEVAAAMTPHPLDTPPGELYPEPHSPELDFGLDTAGAAWIDELAAAANEQKDADPSTPVIGHADWTARNVRLGPDPDVPERVVLAYDWDSLALVPESVIVGQAAQTWCATGDDAHPFPTAARVAAYVHECERARGRSFTTGPWSAIGGAALWILCYAARCEHATAARWPDHDHPTVARDRLRADGEQLLDLDQISRG